MALSLEQYAEERYKDPTIKNILTERIEMQRKKALDGFSIKNRNQIPEDLIIDILSWLPVKALLQFKSMCKLWYDIIKRSYFISKHLRNYYDNNNNWRDCLIVQYSIPETDDLIVYELLIDDTKNRALSYQRIKPPVHNRYLWGPCNGIYFLSCVFFNCSVLIKYSLWNPALNEFKILPNFTCWNKPNLPPDSTYTSESYGFGYDLKTDDYKVILLMTYWDDAPDEYSLPVDNPTSILIYSLRSNSWRYWGDMDNSYIIEWSNSYVFVNGCYYWLAYPLLTDVCGDETIISFDLSAETCQEIPFPQFESKPKYRQLIVYQDSIAFVSIPDDNTRFNVHTWNNEVWTQKLSMKLDVQVAGTFNQWIDNNMIVSFTQSFNEWRDNMLVFRQENGKLVLLDTNTKEIFELDDPKVGDCENICAYKESLVSINNFGRTLSR